MTTLARTRNPMVDPSSVEPSPLEASADTATDLNLWALKPWWCQPWSIVLTGIAAIAGSWVLLGRLWITIPGAVLVLLWWWLFLVLVPAAYRAEASAGGQKELP